MFSVIIPTYNRQDHLAKAIKSVLDQTIKNFELIIIDDGSTDDTKELVKKFQTKAKIKYHYQINKERSAARNKGVKLSSFEWICFLDSDDEFCPNHLELLKKNILKNPTIYFFYTLFNNSNIMDLKNKYEKVFSSTIHSQQVCIKKHILQKFMFDENINFGEDKELWMRIISKYEIFEIPQKTVIINEHSSRSVDLRNTRSSTQSLILTKVLAKKYRDKLSNKVRKIILSDSYFRIAKSNICNDKKISAIRFLISSIYHNPLSKITLHKILLILGALKLFRQSIFNQYSS